MEAILTAVGTLGISGAVTFLNLYTNPQTKSSSHGWFALIFLLIGVTSLTLAIISSFRKEKRHRKWDEEREAREKARFEQEKLLWKDQQEVMERQLKQLKAEQIVMDTGKMV